MRGGQPRGWVDGHARRLLAPFDDAQRMHMADSPEDAIPRLLSVPVQIVDRPPGTGECGIDGCYFSRPPRIVVTQAASDGRTCFSILHETGHHLQAQDDELLDAYERMGRAGGAVEEDVCDAIAAELLLPEPVCAPVSRRGGPTAGDVVELFATTRASREASCVRAASNLAGPGYVVLADRDGTIRFAAAAGTPYGVARGTAQDPGHLLQRAGRHGAGRERATLRHATGTLTDVMHADAVRHDEYVFAVFTRGRPPWGGFSALPEEGPRGTDITCGRCEADVEAFGRPCAVCGDRRCPRCEQCSCAGRAVSERWCARCFLLKAPSQFEGSNEICIDCE